MTASLRPHLDPDGDRVVRDLTHDVFNQATPLEDVNLFDAHRALQDALRFHAPGLDTSRLRALGAEAGSAAMQRHARLANHV